MNILHITAQKPNSTGSGVYMCGIIKGFEELGYKQGVIAGIDIEDDELCFSNDISFYPVKFRTKELDFDLVGMSDSMPYNSTRYRDLNLDMVEKFKGEFSRKIKEAINNFKPDLIICHHLYLLTALTREIVKDIKIFGLCHGTCLRQLGNIDLEKEYIISNIGKLDKILALHSKQKHIIKEIFAVDESKVEVIGSGYNKDIFYDKEYELDDRVINFTYAGKICKSKGLKSLVKSISKLDYSKNSIQLNIVGNGSDIQQYEEIIEETKKSPFKIEFLGRLDQNQLSEIFNKSHIFILPSFYEGLPVVVLEALACGSQVITTDIDGVKDWMGDEINNSGKIDYVKLPRMKGQGIPVEEDLERFEDDLYKAIKIRTNNLINRKSKINNINMNNKTWNGLSLRISEIIENRL
ncbi:MAG: glycosyltransferase family 4 protein [Romboutsia sp.]